MNPCRYDIQTLEHKARAVRCHIVCLSTNSPASGHTRAGFSQVELLTVLYFRILSVTPDRLDDPQYDIYIQSKGHTMGCYYCVLAGAGFFPVERLETYQHANSRLPGYPVRQKAPGIELNIDVLGHGSLVAVGLTLAAKKSSNTRRISLITDGDELAEGSNWKATLATAHYGLDNLVIINDKNNLQPTGSTREIMSTDPLADKWRTFGVGINECQGDDMASVVTAIKGLQQNGKPNVIIANTTKDTEISFIQGRPEWHHRMPKGEEITLALERLKDKQYRTPS